LKYCRIHYEWVEREDEAYGSCLAGDGISWVTEEQYRGEGLTPNDTIIVVKLSPIRENPDALNTWFQLVSNMRAKYGILDCDFYNFDETGFMMGQICPSMVVTRSDRRGRSKSIQPGNGEWATAITCISGDSWDVPPFLIVKAAEVA
jgi:hypothetical protein